MKRLATITCCSPGAPPLKPKEFESLSARFKALADPTRLAIVNRLANRDAACVCEFNSLGLSQPTISHHLKVLREAGLIEVAYKRGTFSFYRLVPEAVETLKRRLFPRARLITPNLPEAAALLDAEVATSEAEMHAQADRLLALGAQAVLIKGGHGSGAESVDLLATPAGVARFAASRIATENTHGSGCTLSAAIAAGLAKGAALADAVGAAKDFISRAIAAADRLAIGSGHGPVHHLHAWW